MLKWTGSLIAFILAIAFVSGLTFHVFISSAISNVDSTKQSLLDKNELLINKSIEEFYNQLGDKKVSIDQIKNMTPSQRQQALSSQCAETEEESPFCNPRFLSGEITLDDAIKEISRKNIVDLESKAMDEMAAKLSAYEKYPLLIISILSGILSLLFYFITRGFLSGLQYFSANITWLSFMSAVSFKLMPAMINKLFSMAQQSAEGLGAEIYSVLKEAITSWLVNSMNNAFWVSVWIFVPSLLIWIGLKLIRDYDFQANE